MSRVRRIELHEKIWRDERGWGINPLEAAALSGKDLGNLHTVSLSPGAVRGNHYHTGATEWLLVCSGPARFAWRPAHQGSIHALLIEQDEPGLFEIPPHVEHAVLNTSGAEIVLISFSNSAERETLPCSSLFPSTL